MKNEWNDISEESLKKLAEIMPPEPMTPEEIRRLLDTSDKGRIKQNKRNCVTVFENDPILQNAIKYNILTGKIDIVKNLGWKSRSATLTDVDMNHLHLYLEDHYELTNEKNIQAALNVVADNNQYHPIREMLNDLEWDGKERVRYALHHFLGADISEYNYEALLLLDYELVDVGKCLKYKDSIGSVIGVNGKIENNVDMKMYNK